STGGNFTDPDQQSWTATVDYGDGTGTQPLTLSNLQSGFTPTGQFNLSHRYADNGVFIVTVKITDQAGGIGIATKQVTVNNVAPQVFGPPSANTNAGSAMNFGCISFFDVPADAPWSATVDYGDGSGEQPATPNVPGSCGGGGTTAGAFSLSHVYASGGNFTITVRVTDKDHATGMRSFPIAVNAAPAVTIDNTPLAAINEGSTFNGMASFTDAAGDGPWTVRINYGDNTGQMQSTVNSLGSIPLSHVYRDNGSYTISVQVMDKFFLAGTATAMLSVNNVAPTLNNLPVVNAITEGQQVNFTISYSDPGLSDNQMPGFKAQINWGDGSALQNMNVPFNTGTGTGSFFVNHTYRDNPAPPDTAFTITVTVTDKDGATSTAKSTEVVVNNAPPSAQLTGVSDLVQSVPATFTGQLFDEGALDAPWSGEVDFGDGVVEPITFALNAPGQTPRATFSVTHTYNLHGPVTLTLRATDKDGTTGTSTFKLDINPVMVSVAVDPTTAWLKTVGTTLLFNGTAKFSDGSTHHTNGNVIDGVTWSSSNPAVATIGENGLASATGPGVTIITLDVHDDYGHQFAAQATLRVDVTAPVITANDITAEATSNSGAAVTLVFSATDDFDSNPVVVADHTSGVFPLGTTEVIVTATDAAGNTSNKTMLVTVVDTTAPGLSLPGDITVDATSPQGAVVNYSATATDLVSGNIAVSCAPPPGSTFAIGTTTVPCSATDAAGNTVSGSFTVLVQAAAAQVTQLITTVQSFNLQQGIANSLDAKLQIILTALNDANNGNSTAVCNQLAAFINETLAQSDKKLTVEQANQLIAAAEQIRAVIGCQ
ncbi:MAG TPA: PKD domain-containing protein, partial [Vicinamibacterales bacterium]|nr:PKD domain-containing protein [Vicinamibacterales bacterium]